MHTTLRQLDLRFLSNRMEWDRADCWVFPFCFGAKWISFGTKTDGSSLAWTFSIRFGGWCEVVHFPTQTLWKKKHFEEYWRRSKCSNGWSSKIMFQCFNNVLKKFDKIFFFQFISQIFVKKIQISLRDLIKFIWLNLTYLIKLPPFS